MKMIETLKFITSHPLNQNRQVASLMKFAKWQIGSRLVPGPIIYSWINDSKFIVRPGETGLTGNIYTGLHEFNDMAFLLHTLRKEDMFVDVGANSGAYSLLACSVVGARGYAIEPVPMTYNRLVQNIRLNELDGKVTCLNVAVGESQGRIGFTTQQDTMNHVLAPDEKTHADTFVSVSTLDTILQEECPALIKIDVEGYETLVLNGATTTLGKESLNSVILELNGSGKRYGFDDGQIIATMQKYGFKKYSYEPLQRTLTELDTQNNHLGNTIFIRDIDLTQNRIRESVSYLINGKTI